MIDIDTVRQKFCRGGAHAVQRYCEVSGDFPESMPEYFMPAFVFNQLGDEITVTLEVGFETLVEWNEGVRKRRGIAPSAPSEELLELARRYLRGRRPDMALFASEEEHKAKEQQDLLALVEFKRGWVDGQRLPGKISDRVRLLMMLAHIDTCPWGIACGCMSKAQRDWEKGESMRGTQDRWHECEITLQERAGAPMFFGARLFARSSDDHRLRELIAATSS